MKKTFLILSLCIQMLVAGTALAYPVDFSGAAGVISGTPYTIGDVTFSYDPSGSSTASASIGPTGISGSSYGSLILDFAVPMISLSFAYTLSNVYFDDLSAGAVTLIAKYGSDFDQVLSSNQTSFTQTGTDLITGKIYGDASGALAFSGNPFNQAFLYFATSEYFDPTDPNNPLALSLATQFTADNFDVTPVPEPSTVVLLAAGLFGLFVGGKRRLKKAV